MDGFDLAPSILDGLGVFSVCGCEKWRLFGLNRSNSAELITSHSGLLNGRSISGNLLKADRRNQTKRRTMWHCEQRPAALGFVATRDSPLGRARMRRFCLLDWPIRARVGGGGCARTPGSSPAGPLRTWLAQGAPPMTSPIRGLPIRPPPASTLCQCDRAEQVACFTARVTGLVRVLIPNYLLGRLADYRATQTKQSRN